MRKLLVPVILFITLLASTETALAACPNEPYFVTVRNECTSMPMDLAWPCIHQARLDRARGFLHKGMPPLFHRDGSRVQKPNFALILRPPSTYRSPRRADAGFTVAREKLTKELGMFNCTMSYRTRGTWVICQNGWWSGPRRLFQ